MIAALHNQKALYNAESKMCILGRMNKNRIKLSACQIILFSFSFSLLCLRSAIESVQIHRC